MVVKSSHHSILRTGCDLVMVPSTQITIKYMKKIMKHHLRIRGTAIALVLICSTLATSAYAWSDAQGPVNLQGSANGQTGGCGGILLCTTAHRPEKNSDTIDWQAPQTPLPPTDFTP